MNRKAKWMPTVENVGDSPAKNVQFSNCSLRLKKGLDVYIFTHSPSRGCYSGQLVQISFLDQDVKEVFSFEFMGYMDLALVMRDEGVVLDASLLEGRDPRGLFDVTVAHFLAAKGVLTIEKDPCTDYVSVSFECGGYDETYRMSIKNAKKLFTNV